MSAKSSVLLNFQLTNPDLINKVKAEFKERKGSEVYTANIPAGPPPIPNTDNN